MTASILLALALVQAPNSSLATVQFDADIQALALGGEPILAPGIAVKVEAPTTKVALRIGRVDAWGCLYGLAYCRHEMATITDGAALGDLFMLRAIYHGAAVSCGNSRYYCNGFVAGCVGFQQCQLYLIQQAQAREFVETSQGLRLGKEMAAEKARLANPAGSVPGYVPPSRSGSVSSGATGGGGGARSASSSSPPPSSRPSRGSRLQ